MSPPKGSRADILHRSINAILDIPDRQGEHVPVWRVMALAAGIGPYLVELHRDKTGEVMLRVIFEDDGSDIHVTPDGDTGGLFAESRSPVRKLGLSGDPS